MTMKIKIFLPIVLLSITFPSLAQPSAELDSLYKIWHDKSAPDSSRVRAAGDIAIKGLLYTDPDSAIAMAGHQEALARENGFTGQIISAINIQGNALSLKGENETAMEKFQFAYDLAKKEGKTLAMANATYLMGNSSIRLGKNEQAEKYYTDSKDLFQSIENEEGKSRSTYGLANLQRIKGDYVNALDNFQQVLEFYEKDGAIRNVIVILQTIANLHKNIGNYDIAIEMNNKVLALAEKHGNKSGRPNALAGLGSIYGMQKDYDKAIDYFEQSVSAAKEAGTKPTEAMALCNLASAHTDNKNYLEAKEIALEANQVCKSLNYPLGIHSSTLVLAKIAIENNKLTDAIHYGNKALSGFQEIKEINYIAESAEILYKAHKEKGNLRTALAMHEIYTEAADSLKSDENKNAVIRQEFQYRYDQQIFQDSIQHTQELAILESANKRQKTIIIIVLLGLLLFGILCYFIYNLYQRTKSQNALIQKTLGEKEILLKEIHHRVKNNLQLISSLLTLQSRDITDESVIAAINAGKSRVRSMALIHQDLYAKDNLTGISVQNYLNNLCKELFTTYNISEDDLQLELDIQDMYLDVDTIIPLGLILNELITNSLKYAFTPGQQGTLSIKLKEEEDTLLLSVVDDGVGLQENQSSESTSFGSKLIRTLTEQLDGELRVDGEAGMSVTIVISDYKMAV